MSFGQIGSQAVRCGSFVLDQPQTYRKLYETASWWTEIEVPAGEYEITTNGYWYFVRLAGVVTDEHFVNRLLGHESLAEKRNLGNPATHTIQSYSHDLARLFAIDPEHYVMDDEWLVQVSQWGGPSEQDEFRAGLSNGKRRTRFVLIPPKAVEAPQELSVTD